MNRSLWLLLLACIGLTSGQAVALDCEKPERGDYAAICRDPELAAVEARRVVLVERLSLGRPTEEAQVFSSYERRWVVDRNSVCPYRADGIDGACLKQAIEDHVAELGSLDRLRFVSRERPDNDRGENPKLDIHATWVEFEAPQGRGERLFNERVREKVDHLPFAVPYDGKTTWHETIDVRAIYRSSALISVTFAEWSCCGAHGAGGDEVLNIDLRNGQPFVPENWFDLDGVAAACWLEFVVSDDFRARYSLRNALVEFSANLGKSQTWSFSRRGVSLQFHELMGHAGGNYVCRLGYGQLARLAVSGVELPP